MKWVLAILIVAAGLANGATYYVSPSGNDSTGDGSIGNPWLSFYKLNSMAAGDVGYLRGGTYWATNNLQYFKPSNSGTAGSPIIVSNYPTEIPVITGSTNNQMILALDDVNWIKMFGLTITNCARPVQWQRATNCEMGYCTVTCRGAVPFGTGDNYLVRIWDGSSSNWIHHCTVSKGMIGDPTVPVSQEGGDATPTFCFVLGNYLQGHQTLANRVENCTVFAGGHDVFSVSGNLNVIRSNWFYNAGWYLRANYTNLMAGNRAMASDGPSGGRNLVEWNRIGPTGWTYDNGSAGYTVVDHGNIIRNNTIHGCANFGLELYTKDYGGAGISFSSSNYVYNNTFAYNGWTPNYATNNSTGVAVDGRPYKAVFHFVNSTNDVIINNVFWRGWGNPWFGPTTNAIATYAGTSIATWANNYSNSSVELGFVDAGIPWSDAYSIDTSVSQSSPDWRVAIRGSPLVNSGGFLTTVTSASGSGTSFMVSDPRFFCDGWGIISGDSIQLEGQTLVRTISAIDYSTSTVTVSGALTWTNGQGLSLAYSGSAPDIGAYECDRPFRSRITSIRANKMYSPKP